jgi:hypothetical protein
MRAEQAPATGFLQIIMGSEPSVVGAVLLATTGPTQMDAKRNGRDALYPKKSTTVPFSTIAVSFFASQFVCRMQPCDMVLLTLPDSSVPWMP